MSILMDGIYQHPNGETSTRTYTAAEATALIKEGHRGMLSFFGTYEIEGIPYHASALSVGDETYIYEKNDKLIVPTYFPANMLKGYEKTEKRVFVEVTIDPKEATALRLILAKET